MSSERPQRLSSIQQAVYDIADALDNPIDNHGNHYDFRYLKPVLAWHLARAGIGKVEGQAVIKRRELPGGYVEWVDINAPDAPPDPLAGKSLEEIAATGTPEQREAAIRRLQGNPDPEDLDAQIPWKVRTNIQLDEESLT